MGSVTFVQCVNTLVDAFRGIAKKKGKTQIQEDARKFRRWRQVDDLSGHTRRVALTAVAVLVVVRRRQCNNR